MDAKGGCNSIRPFALKLLAKKRLMLLLGAVLCTECAALSSVPLIQCQLSYSLWLYSSWSHRDPHKIPKHCSAGNMTVTEMSSHSLESFLISLCCSAVLAFSQCSSRFYTSLLFPTLQKVFKAECLSSNQLPAIGSINTKGEASKIGLKREIFHLCRRSLSISLQMLLKYLSSGSVQRSSISQVLALIHY